MIRRNAPEALRMQKQLKSYVWVATTQNMDQADLPDPKAITMGTNSKNVEYCKAMIQSRAGVLKGRPPPPARKTGGKAMPPPQPQVPTGLAEQVRLMDAKLQLLLDNQARMAKGAKALNPSEKKQEKPVPKQMVAMPIRADHNCSKYLLGFIKDLVKDKGAKLDQSPERLEITKRELVQHILDYLHDECKKDESVFMQHFGQAPQQYISKLLDGRGTDSWLGVPAFTAFVKKSPIELRLVLTREFDEKGQPDKSCGQIQIVGSPNQEKKTHVVFTMWNGSHFDLAQDTDGKKCFEIGEEADEAGKKLVAQIRSKAKLGEVLQRAVSAGDQAARTAALDEYCRAQRESSLNGKRSKKTSKTKQQKQPRKAKAQEGNPQPKHKPGVCSYFEAGQRCPHNEKGKCRFQCYSPKVRGRSRSKNPGSRSRSRSSASRATSKARSRGGSRPRGRSPPADSPKGRSRRRSPSADGSERWEEVRDRGGDKVVKAVVVFTSIGRDAVMRKVDKETYRWVHSAHEIGAAREDTRAPRVILHVKSSKMDNLERNLQAIRATGLKAARFKEQPQREPPESKAREGLERARARANGTCNYFSKRAKCPYDGRCRFACYDNEPDDPLTPKCYR